MVWRLHFKTVILTEKCAADIVVPVEEEMVLQGKSDTLKEIRRYYGMEMNVSKNKVLGISGKQTPVQIMVNQKLPGECGMFQLCG